jgi:hypothetical protein
VESYLMGLILGILRLKKKKKKVNNLFSKNNFLFSYIAQEQRHILLPSCKQGLLRYR